MTKNIKKTKFRMVRLRKEIYKTMVTNLSKKLHKNDTYMSVFPISLKLCQWYRINFILLWKN